MGLDAWVRCNCYPDAVSSEPPVPKECLEIDSDGYLSIKPEFETDERWRRFYAWRQNCCRHRNMRFVSERISNWPGYRMFQEALDLLGWHQFPVLQRELPNSNGGFTDAASAEAALAELAGLGAMDVIGEKSVLINTATDEIIQQSIPAYDDVFFEFAAGLEIGIDKSGLFVRASDDQRMFFRARHIRQAAADGQPITNESTPIILEGLSSGQRIEIPAAISGKAIPWDDGEWTDADGRHRFEYPSDLHQENRPWRVCELEGIIDPLRIVFAASVETGNPVQWT